MQEDADKMIKHLTSLADKKLIIRCAQNEFAAANFHLAEACVIPS